MTTIGMTPTGPTAIRPTAIGMTAIGPTAIGMTTTGMTATRAGPTGTVIATTVIAATVIRPTATGGVTRAVTATPRTTPPPDRGSWVERHRYPLILRYGCPGSSIARGTGDRKPDPCCLARR